MAIDPTILWRAPEINPINHKARSIPGLNPLNKYGRVFTFSWLGFLIAFWSWYAFPPLLSITIAKDLKLKPTQVANSNIVSLAATLLVRLVAGPSCDRFGPRWTFAGCLLAGSIPTALAGCVTNASGLYALRFFIGILGGSFVPCQVWTTGFFDKNVVGTANALTGGLGNSGGGITYFLMPAVFDSLVQNRGLTPHVAWRVAFIVPFIAIVAVATGMIVLCPDTPTGKWADRHLATEQSLSDHLNIDPVVDVPGVISAKPGTGSGSESPSDTDEKLRVDATIKVGAFGDHEAHLGEQEMLDTARGEIIAKPSFKEAAPVLWSMQTLVMGACYFNSFGAELAINSILGSYYVKNFPKLGQTGSGNWAAMFGLLNVFFRPLGGVVADIAYNKTKNLWSKKMLIHAYGVIAGAFLIAIGLVDSKDQSTMFGLIAGMAFFLDGGNGLNYALVPHVHPHANGIVSGVTGASGNLGGIVFAIIFRLNHTDYARVFWIIGLIGIGMNVAVSWIRPIPRKQIGGR